MVLGFLDLLGRRADVWYAERLSYGVFLRFSSCLKTLHPFLVPKLHQSRIKVGFLGRNPTLMR